MKMPWGRVSLHSFVLPSGQSAFWPVPAISFMVLVLGLGVRRLISGGGRGCSLGVVLIVIGICDQCVTFDCVGFSVRAKLQAAELCFTVRALVVVVLQQLSCCGYN